MSNHRNPFDDATAVADPSDLPEELQKELQKKSKRNFANVVKRKNVSSSPAPIATATPASAPIASRAHVIRRDAVGLPEDSGEVLLTPPQITVPAGKAGSSGLHPDHSGVDEFTVEDGSRPQAPASLSNLAAQASLAVAPPDDPDRGFLLITAGNDAGRKVGLPEGRTTIGRGIDCDIVLTDIAVSRRHMYVERRDNVYFVCDLGSGNGTYVNNNDRRGEVVVVNGDTFQIGSTVFRLEGPDAQNSASTSSHWQPKPVTAAFGKQSPSTDRMHTAPIQEEESTVAGKGLATVTYDEANDPPSEELPTNIVASVEVEPQTPEAPTYLEAPQQPPEVMRAAGDAALDALSSIVQTPPPGESTVMPLETGDLAKMSAPDVPAPSSPYPIPSQYSGGQPPPNSMLPRPNTASSAPPMQGHMGIAPTQQSSGMMPLQGSYPMPGSISQGSISQGSIPVMGRPMLAGARPDFHNPYPPANRPVPQKRGRLLIGIISLAMVVVAVGIVAAVVTQGDEETVASEAVGAADTELSGAAAPVRIPPPTDSVTEADPTAETAAASTTEAEGPKPILVASLIAGTNSLPASTWGTDESFQADLPPLETAPEPVAIPVLEPEPEDEPEPAPEPVVVKTKPEPVVTDSSARKPIARKPIARKPRVEPEPRRDEPEDEPEDEPDRGDADASSIKASARSLYKRRKFDEAAAHLNKGANRIDDDDVAMGLSDTADAYKKVGSYLGEAEKLQNSDPAEALDLFKKALSQDKKHASSSLAGFIRLRIGQVAPKAARTFMARGKLAEAKKAADTAKRYDQLDAVQAIYKSLEKKADSLIKKALKAKKNGDDDEARDLLREATTIAPKGTSAYDTCRKELRKL